MNKIKKKILTLTLWIFLSIIGVSMCSRDVMYETELAKCIYTKDPDIILD